MKDADIFMVGFYCGLLVMWLMWVIISTPTKGSKKNDGKSN